MSMISKKETNIYLTRLAIFKVIYEDLKLIHGLILFSSITL